MLRDLIYELPDLLADADRNCPSYRAGVYAVVGMLKNHLGSFEIDQSRFARQMPDVDAWYLRKTA